MAVPGSRRRGVVYGRSPSVPSPPPLSSATKAAEEAEEEAEAKGTEEPEPQLFLEKTWC
jgi:hypothetical protein